MAGLVPAIHVFDLITKKTWMPAPSAGMTIQLNLILLYARLLHAVAKRVGA
jgi:uncharacterized protein (UPF0262 family)